MYCPRCDKSSYGYACTSCGLTERELTLRGVFQISNIPLPIDPPGFDASKIQSTRKISMSETVTSTDIKKHEGAKYLRLIRPASKELDPEGKAIHVDVYAVLEAFHVTSQPIGHAIKKLLCAGERGKGDRLSDLVGAIAALNRAIDMEKVEE